MTTKTVSEQLIEMLSENLDTLSEEELLDECAEDFGSVDAMVEMFDAAVVKATAQASSTKSLPLMARRGQDRER